MTREQTLLICVTGLSAGVTGALWVVRCLEQGLERVCCAIEQAFAIRDRRHAELERVVAFMRRPMGSARSEALTVELARARVVRGACGK